jgi:3-hydroxyisobutyrate dehydrogenase-like beta-hydroxyacid dehydrogenase
MKTVAFVGLGAMGAPMAGNLLEVGFPLRVFNRDPRRTSGFAERGAVVCASAAEAVSGADFVVSIVSDDAATAEVMLGEAGVVAAAAPGTLIVDCSTNTPQMSRAVSTAAAARGCLHVDAPVSGSIAQARDRELVFMVGGTEAAYRRAQPLFEAMGRMHRLIGGSGAGATIKLINNMLSGTVTAAIAKALSVAEAAGLDPQASGAILNEGAAASRLTRTKLPKIQTRDFAPQFQLALMEKDLRYFLALAQDVDRPTPIAALVRSQLQAAKRAGLGTLDVSAVFLHVTGEKRD